MQNVCVLKISADTSFDDIVRAVEAGGHGFVALVNKTGKLEGVVTDGDIRRCLLQSKLNLNSVINRTPKTWSSSYPEKSADPFMRRLHLRHLPVVDESGTLIKILSLDDSNFNIRNESVVLMAGGLGTRLLPLTKDRPKPMLEVGGKPILENLIDSFVKYGFVNFYISVNYLADQIIDHFGDGTKFGINIQYIHEKKRLGTAGALSMLKSRLKEDFIVANGDILTNLDFLDALDFHNTRKSDLTICARQHDVQVQYGVLHSDSSGRLVDMVEKPSYSFFINSGIYILNQQVLSIIPDDQYFDMPQLVLDVMKRRQDGVSVYKFNEYWADIGQLSSYHGAKDFFESRSLM